MNETSSLDGRSAAGRDDAIRLLAFYLPQYYPTAENDEWWGPGFTEWTNVVRGTPQFRHHYQPRLPADLGFYDLRLDEIREQQAELARTAGIAGFVYYHYWFLGRRLLNLPLDRLLATGRPDFPFALCWANESWEKRWWRDSDEDVLIRQDYSSADWTEHANFLLDVMEDRRYLTLNGRHILLVYRPDAIPDVNQKLDTWRELAGRRGMELHLCAVGAGDPLTLGFDAAVEFVPNSAVLGRRVGFSGIGRVYRATAARRSPLRANSVYRYSEMVDRSLALDVPAHTLYRCVTPDWDNASRRRGLRARILVGSSPSEYQRWLEGILALPDTRDLVLINAWNEWGEGAYLEPDCRWGHGYLHATRRALDAHAARSCPRS